MDFAHHHREAGVACGTIVDVVVVLPAHLGVSMSQLLQGHLKQTRISIKSKIIDDKYIWKYKINVYIFI